MKRSISAMAMVAFFGGLIGGTICGQMRTLHEAAEPRTLPPERVVATGHPPGFMLENGPAVTASAPAGTASAPATAITRAAIARPIIVRPMAIQPPALRTIKLGELALFTGRGGRLFVTVQPPASGQVYYYQVNVEGFEGMAIVQQTSLEGIPGNGLTINFNGPTGRGAYIQLSRTELRVRMAIAGEGVELTQQMKGDLGEVLDDAGAVTMNVWRNGVYSGSPAVSLRAADLRRLRVEQPVTFRKYLRPLLAKLGAERAGLPDAPEAAQILTPLLTVDSATETKFAAILADLDADAREMRDAASSKLRELGWHAALAARKVDMKKLSVEQRVRLRDFLAEYTYLDDRQAEQCRSDVDVLVDCLALEDAVLVKAAAAQLEAVTGKKLTVDANLPAEKRLAMLEEWRKTAKDR